MKIISKFVSLIPAVRRSTDHLPNSKTLISISALAVLALVIFGILPALQDISLAAGEVRFIKTDLENKRASQYSLSDILNNYRLAQPKIETLSNALRTKNRALEFITALEAIAFEQAVDQKITIGRYEEIASTTISRMPLQLVINGDFSADLRYLQSLEKLPAYVNIKSVNLTRSGGSSRVTSSEKTTLPAPAVEMTISADTYWQ